MGLLKEKYTKAYFTGEDDYGNKLNYGAEKKVNDNGEYILRDHDLNIVNKVDFKNKRVLEFGVGRGECAKYLLLNGAIDYVGVDFSEAALDIATNITKGYEDKAKFILEDAYVFIKNNNGTYNDVFQHLFDIVIMLDFVEHVPRNELGELFNELQKYIGEKSILIINTPAFQFDNDVVVEGLDKRNHENSIDTADFVKETEGMHCNKYTVLSLQEFMSEHGFVNITEAHFWKKKKRENILSVAYRANWETCCLLGYPLCPEFFPDVIEYAYNKGIIVKRFDFTSGNLAGISIMTSEEYKNIAFKNGNYDIEMFDDYSKFHKTSEVILDVGGFMGVSSLLFAKYSADNCQVYSFEPNPWNLNRMQVNVSINERKICNKIKFINMALSDKTEIVDMLLSDNIDDGFSSTSRINHSHSTLHKEQLPVGFFNHKVQAITLDDFVLKFNIVPDVIKVDIEGAEHLFLIGAREVLKKYHPVMYMEIHSEFCAIKCMEILHNLNYEVNVLNEEPDNRVLIKAKYKGWEISSLLNNLKKKLL